MTSTVDSIPNAINGANPVVAVGVQTNGWMTYGREDRDVYRLDLEAGKSYVLAGEKLGSWWLDGFSLLDAAGQPAAVDLVRFDPDGPEYYSSHEQFYLRFDVDTTLYLAIQGQFRTSTAYTFRLSEVSVTPHTAGADVLAWDNARDIHDGGAGQDTLSFAGLAAPVVVELYHGLIRGEGIVPPSSRLSIRNVEIIEGTAGNDRLIGDHFRPGYDGAYDIDHDSPLPAITWRGLDGDDTLGTTAGVTVFDGGDGTDTADYSGADGAVRVSLLEGTGTLGDAAGDRLTLIENLTGGPRSDHLTGNHGANLLLGGHGFDTLVGLGGDDTLDGGFTNPYSKDPDRLSRAVFRFDRSEYTITVTADDKGVLSAIVDHTGGDRSDGRDTLSRIAWAEFADQSLWIGDLLDTVADGAGPDAPLLALGETAVARAEHPGDRDIFAIDLQAGQLYRFSRLQDALFAAEDLVLLNPAGEAVEIFGPDPRDTYEPRRPSVVFRAPETGRFHVELGMASALDTADPGYGFTLGPEIAFRIDAATASGGATEGDDRFLASALAAGAYVDGRGGRDTFVSDPVIDPASRATTVWSVYLAADPGGLPTVFLNDTRPGNRHDIQIVGVETFVGSDADDLFQLHAQQGHRHAGQMAFYGGRGADHFSTTLGHSHFDGGDGVDKLSYDAWSGAIVTVPGQPPSGVHVDLVAGIGRNGHAEGDTYRSIEAVSGTDLADVLIGNDQTTALYGSGGDDWITAGANGHAISGGYGTDMASFITLAEIAGRPATAARLVISPYLATPYGTGAATYALDGIENITGTVFNDLITGNAAANLLRGSGGYDWFVATAGGDTVDGGAGEDMVSFIAWQNTAANLIGTPFGPRPPGGAQATGVLVDLANPANNTHLAAGLALMSVERVTGSGRQDVFYGDARQNDFRGLGDFDWFVASDGGRERYFGGDGVDTVTYFNAPGAVSASLRNGAVVNGQETGFGARGWAAQDLYFEVENLVGSTFGDSLTGNEGRNQLNGLGGDDLLFGFGGTDYLMGGAGNDSLNGGGGSDYALFDGARGAFALTRTSWNQITVSGPAGTDRLTDVEYLQFDDLLIRIWDLPLA